MRVIQVCEGATVLRISALFVAPIGYNQALSTHSTEMFVAAIHNSTPTQRTHRQSARTQNSHVTPTSLHNTHPHTKGSTAQQSDGHTRHMAPRHPTRGLAKAGPSWHCLRDCSLTRAQVAAERFAYINTVRPATSTCWLSTTSRRHFSWQCKDLNFDDDWAVEKVTSQKLL